MPRAYLRGIQVYSLQAVKRDVTISEWRATMAACEIALDSEPEFAERLFAFCTRHPARDKLTLSYLKKRRRNLLAAVKDHSMYFNGSRSSVCIWEFRKRLGFTVHSRTMPRIRNTHSPEMIMHACTNE
eukprot:COSAG05_NODE_1910_length_3845_cov_2.662306_7_plen_128_part_00